MWVHVSREIFYFFEKKSGETHATFIPPILAKQAHNALKGNITSKAALSIYNIPYLQINQRRTGQTGYFITKMRRILHYAPN